MPDSAHFESFEQELLRLVAAFERGLGQFKSSGYVEAQLRDDFLNPFWRALGWDLENKAGLVQEKREVAIESRTEIGDRQERADYLFRTDAHDRFVCEAKKPAEELVARHAFQAKCYAWNKGVALALLTNFEHFNLYIVGGRPYLAEPLVGLWKTWHFRELPLKAREIWDLLARDSIAAGSIDRVIDSLPKASAGKGKARQQWLIKPDSSRALDVAFLNFLDVARRELGFDLICNNERADLLEGNKLNEAVQRIIDRLLFLRICEARDIDTGVLLVSIVQTWGRNYDKEEVVRAHQKPLELREEPPADFGFSGLRAPKDSLWRYIVRHFRALDRRPPSHVPFFNGNLFKPHFSEELVVGDGWLSGFIADLTDEESPYRFSYIPVDILGTIYERFLGKVVRPQGRGVTIEEKPEVRKAGGVYYTPRYIVEYIVAQTVEKLLQNTKPETTLKLHFLDPACGSGGFLLRVFEAVCEHWEKWFIDHPDDRKKKWCWVDEETGNIHLTMALKRQILTSNVFGVDLDPGAVEVTQLSLYLKMIEKENRNTLKRQRKLLPDDDDALLPPLENNIKRGNSLIASDFSMIPEDLVRVHAFDWNVGFKDIIKAGGFDAVVGNPPYIFTRNQGIAEDEKVYFYRAYQHQSIQLNTFGIFVEKSLELLRKDGKLGFITPNNWLTIDTFAPLRGFMLASTSQLKVTNILERVFEAADVDTCVVVFQKGKPDTLTIAEMSGQKEVFTRTLPPSSLQPPSYIIQIGLLKDAKAQNLLTKIERASESLSFYATVSTGLKVYQTGKGKPTQTDKHKNQRMFHSIGKRNKTYGRYLDGVDVCRYRLGWSGEWLSYGDWIAEPRRSVPFDGERILVRQIPASAPYLVHGVFTSEQFYNDINSMIIFAPSKSASLKYLLAIINSRLVSFWFQKKFDKLQRKIFPQFKVKELADFPIAKIELTRQGDKARHDKLVNLVDKMLGLTPKLRVARLESEKATLQNAVTAAEQQIDALVYELYGLTEQEIKLVEENA
jgi:adenine-specific DNA-methyltransferase